ncbi:hypothetical protein Tco_1080204 [Tanacetum coccineum]|uniref:Uncharacterized protein n=1 Tax=Tanacetum coccineum TaxID=301880 RepID=A0ABQ5HUB0_9ASTR
MVQTTPRPKTPDLEWNQDKNVDDELEQTWFNDLVNVEKDSLTFDELMATPIDFTKFAMNHLKLDKITKANLVRAIYKLLKGACKSSIKLEHNMDQCYNALTDQLDWTNPEHDRGPYDLSKPLPLQGSLCHLTIHVNFFFNNDLKYLKTKNSERKYTTLITKTKAVKYELEFVEDMIPKLWSPVKVAYDKNAKLGILHWGPKRQLFYRSQINRFSKHEVYSTMKILSMIRVKADKRLGYGYLEEIVVRRDYGQEYSFKEVHMFTRSLVVKKRVEDVQLGVESYQKKLNITKPQKNFPGISFKEPYTTTYDPKGVVYLDLRKRKRLMRADELYKFSDRTLKSVREILHYRLLNIKLGYNKYVPKRK